MPQATNSDQPTCIFLHFGKTAGSTLGTIIDRQYPNDRLYVMQKNIDNDHFINQPESKRAQVLCVRGITYYGIHEHIPRPTTYFTLLRHPVDRVISQYFYNQRRHVRDGLELKREIELEKLLHKQDIHTRMQISMIIGGKDMQTAIDTPLPPNAVELAKQRLRDHFSVVGLVERFDESLLLMKYAFGWQNIYFGTRNVAPDRSQRDRVSPDVIKLIEQKAAPEIELYEYVRDQFDATMRQQPPELLAELKKFQERNQLYSKLWQRTSPIRKTALWRMFRRALMPVWKPWDAD